MKAATLGGMVLMAVAGAGGMALVRPNRDRVQPLPATAGRASAVAEVAEVSRLQPKTVVRTLEDLSLFDLRGWQKPDSGAKGRESRPAAFVNVLRMRKLDADASLAVAHYATSGTVIDLSCLTFTCTAERAAKSDHTSSWTEYAVKAEIGAVPKGSEFMLVVHGTFWDGFRNDTLESAETYLDYDGDPDTSLRLAVLFPPAKPGRVISLESVEDTSGVRTAIPVVGTLGADTARREVTWRIDHPQPGHHYVMQWRW
jgi:hypothetical protein